MSEYVISEFKIFYLNFEPIELKNQELKQIRNYLYIKLIRNNI